MNLYISSFKMKAERIILLLILIILGILMVNILRKESDFSDSERKQFWISKTHSKRKYPVVFAGDSRIYRGISPSEFEKNFENLEAMNLGYSSLGYHLEYLKFLENRLDTNADTSIIIFGISPDSFSKKGFRAESFMREKYERKKEEILVYTYLYPFQKYFLPFDIDRILPGEKKSSGNPNYIQTLHSDGWIESHWLESDTSFYLNWIHNSWKNNSYDEAQTQIFLRKVNEWTTRGIKVAGFRTPATKSVMALEDSLSGFNLGAFRSDFENAGGKWIETEPTRYSTYDGNHLEHGSALKLSSDIALAIKEIYFHH